MNIYMFDPILCKGFKRKTTEDLCVTPKRARFSETPDIIVKVCLVVILIIIGSSH